MADYLLKDHNFGLRSAGNGRLTRRSRLRQGSAYLRNTVMIHVVSEARVRAGLRSCAQVALCPLALTMVARRFFIVKEQSHAGAEDCA